MSWIWGCMVLSFNVAMGGIFWVICFGVAAFIFAGIGAVIVKALN